MRLKNHILQVLSSRTGEKSPEGPRSGYVIFSGPYLSNSAGVNCLHRLCDELNRAGYPSFTTGGDIAAPHLNAPIIDEESAAALCAGGFIAIYPETVSGNRLKARDVVRWVLNRPGLLGGDEIYNDSELVFSYSDVFSPYSTRPCFIATTPIFRSATFSVTTWVSRNGKMVSSTRRKRLKSIARRRTRKS
jgi:hypothetical protein